MKCIIVDDEPLAREILEEFTGRVPFLELKDSCKNAYEALEALKKEDIDLLFLDIQMPDLTGVQLYHSLAEKPMVIFTTAYSNYAVEGFELDAVDYLLKPFSFERFLKAVNKANELVRLKSKGTFPEQVKNFIFIKDGNKIVKINLNDILYLQGMKDYIKIVLSGKYILTLMPFGKMLDKLPADKFVRVHRSYIISLAKINSIERNRLVINNEWIPIGKLYKEDFFKKLN